MVILKSYRNISSLFRAEASNLKTRPLRHPHLKLSYLDKLTRSTKGISSREHSRWKGLRFRGSQESLEDLNEVTMSDQPNVSETQESKNDNDDLKIYLAKKCSCTKLELQYRGTPYLEFHRLDTNKNLSDKCNFSTVMEPSNDTNNLQWQPESYVSNQCQLVNYHSSNDLWWLELSQDCSPIQEGIYLIWSSESVPCIEYLPPPRHQKWMYFKRLSVFDRPDNETIVLNYCGEFKESIYENISVQCVMMEEESN